METAVESERERVQRWLRWCLGNEQVKLGTYQSLGRHSGCELVACETDRGTIVLKRYAPGCDDSAGLGPVGTARKNLLALQEMPPLGVPTPLPLGFAARGEEAALAMEWLETEPLTPSGRLEAARVLARLHGISLGDLSGELADLVTRSRPHVQQWLPGEPPLHERTLQHGDYWSPNVAATRGGVRVLDWDYSAWGDPMYDLANLLKTELHKEDREAIDVQAVTRAYRQARPVDSARLDWQMACLESYFETYSEIYFSPRDQDG
jgi:aminoglycoside phosphotransferase (APT) family kinase protein